MPERSSVWSSSSLPGTVGSGICFTQTAMFMGGFWSPGRLRFQTGRYGRRPCPRPDPIEVLVVGAGPAGAAAAIEARRLGLDVLVVDKARFPRDKTCGDGLTTGALRAARAARGRRARVAVVRVGHRDRPRVRRAAARSRSRCRPTASTPAWCRARSSTPRSSRTRERKGSTVRDGVGGRATCAHRADEVRRRARRRHDRSTRGGSIAADGHYSPDAAHARRHDRRRPPTSGRGTRSASTSAASTTRGSGCCSTPTCSPGTRGCSRWAAGAPTSASACCATRAAARVRWQAPRRAVARCRRQPARCAPSSGPAPSPTARTAPGRSPPSFDPARLVHGRVLFVGDAAGVVDPMTGEGIAQAIETGMLAARAIAGDATPDAVGARYRREVDARARRRPPVRARRSSTCCARRSARAPRSVPRGSRPWTRRNFARWMFEDYPRAAVLTPAPLAPGHVQRPGRLRRDLRPCCSSDDTPTLGDGRHRTLAAHAALVERHPARHAASPPRRARRARLRRAARPRPAGPRVGVPLARVHGLEERRRHQLRADRHRRRRARLPRVLEAGRRASRQGRPLHLERGALPDASSPRSSRSAPTSAASA